jgi:hypothetical protein
LSINSIVNRDIGVNRARSVVGVVTINTPLICPVAVACTTSREKRTIEVLGISGKSLLYTNTTCSRNDSAIVCDTFDSITKVKDVVAAVKLK